MKDNSHVIDDTQRVLINGAEIAYSDRGEGPLAIYAHGLTSSRAADARMNLYNWSFIVESGRRLVTYDARGHGRSGGRPVDTDYTWSNLATDLLMLLDYFGAVSPVNGIGSSMGTGTVLHAAIRAPDRFNRLVLSTPPTAWETREPQVRMYQAGAKLIEQKSLGAFEEMSSQAPRPEILADVPAEAMKPDVTEDLLPFVMRGAALSDLPDETSISELRLPVLILAWAGDPGHPLSTAEKLASLIPGAQLEIAHTRDELQTWGELTARFLSKG